MLILNHSLFPQFEKVSADDSCSDIVNSELLEALAGQLEDAKSKIAEQVCFEMLLIHSSGLPGNH